MSSGAFALFIDLTAGPGGSAKNAQRVIPFPHASHVRLSLVCGFVPMPGSATTYSVTFIDASGNSVGTSIPATPLPKGQFVPPTSIPSGAVEALVELTFPTANLPVVTALVQFD